MLLGKIYLLLLDVGINAQDIILLFWDWRKWKIWFTTRQTLNYVIEVEFPQLQKNLHFSGSLPSKSPIKPESLERQRKFNSDHVAPINSISNFEGLIPFNLKPICDYNIHAVSVSSCRYFNFSELFCIISYHYFRLNKWNLFDLFTYFSI